MNLFIWLPSMFLLGIAARGSREIHMFRYLAKSVFLLLSLVGVTCIIYPLALWRVGSTLFPFQANGSLLQDLDGKWVGSKLIAQPFSKDEYFQPRPSAASYDATASASSALAASNYALRDRIARVIGPLAKYASGPKANQNVGPDIELWFASDNFQGQPHIVAQWANLHHSAQAWVNSDPSHAAFVDDWAKSHQAVVAKFIKDNPNTPKPTAADLAVVFFQHFSEENPGKFPIASTQTVNGKMQTIITASQTGSAIQSIFFDMWRQEHPNVDLQELPGDYVTTSASGLDPHISLQNARFQLDRVASKWANHLKRENAQVRNEINQLLEENAAAPWAGLIGEKFVNVLEINLELNKRYGEVSSK